MADVIIETRKLSKSFTEARERELSILSDIDFSLASGESCSIIGNSGSGKSTFLELCATLLRPTSGQVLFLGRDTGKLREGEVSALRNRKMGFIFQNSLLLSDFTALENVMMPALIGGETKAEARRRAEELLSRVSLLERANHRNDTLSGGERQRVAVARALVNHPPVIFADEPTGSLDEKNARVVEELLFSLVRREGTALLLVTHNSEFAHRADKVYHLHDRSLHEIA